MPETLKMYVMPSFSGRNIVIFSDGTGQAGGLVPDETRSNVYKVFRATRCGPDTKIDPSHQLTFYDPGLGSKAAGTNIKVGWVRWFYNIVSSATGLGITRNIRDCYEALIRLWRPGDRIFLFGFSRGAYTVRCLGGVLSLCGIPTKNAGEPLLRNPATLSRISKEAVGRVYSHGSGDSDVRNFGENKLTPRTLKLRQQRKALGEQFRKKYSSDGPLGANVVPHFIGVWDTVAAVGISPPAWRTLIACLLAIMLCIAGGIGYLRTGTFDAAFWGWTAAILVLTASTVYVLYFVARVKFVTGLAQYPWWQTVHLTSLKMKFFDKVLNKNVRYARHALAIDELRADFDRVPWVDDGNPPNRELDEGAWFEQYWFAGNHSDIGGSYPENESRLSDIALGWMVHEARRAGLIVNEQLLALFGNPDGSQHDECKSGISFLGMKFKWRQKLRKMVDNATIHHSVKQRLDLPSVLIYDEECPYRPELLRKHQEFSQYYPTSILPTPN